jgi:AhpD family alkylhydroperoxidase
MSHYHDTGDGKFAAALRKGAPDVAKAFHAFNNAALHDPNRVIPQKYRELIALACSLVTQCPYCIEAHVKSAMKLGATTEEIAEVSFMASALLAGSGYAHGFMAMKIAEQSSSE